MCVARFDDDTKESFLDLYTKIDAGVITSPSEENAEEVKEFLDTRIKDIEEAMKTLTVQKNEMTQQYNSIRTALNTIVQGQQNVRQN